VEENIDILQRMIRWDVLQSEFQPASHKIADQRPPEIAVAISTHNDHSGSNRPQLIKNRFRANIAKMPDLISVLGHLPHALRQMIVRVRENEHALSLFGVSVSSHVAL
jgi:hypothetical protein